MAGTMSIRVRAVLGVAVVGVIAAMIVFGLILADSQRSARDDISGRFSERAGASGALTASLFGSAAATARTINGRLYGNRHVPTATLARRARDSGNQYLLVLNSDGTINAASPGTPAAAEQLAEAGPGYIREALGGRPYALSDLQTKGLPGPGVTYASSFDTRYGKRVLVAGVDGKLLAAFLGGSLKQLPRVAGGHTYVLDSRGAIIGSPEQALKVGARVPEAGLIAALRGGRQGSFANGRHFAAAPIVGTPWRVVLTAPSGKLFASVNGSNRWVPWVLLIGFGVAALTAVALVLRVLRGAAKVETVNAELNVANDALGDRATQLAHANAELERSNEELERFASIASHDLREPLRKVQMFGERVTHHEAAALSDRGRDYLDRMTSAARRMEDLIDGLLLFSRVTTQVGRREDVNLAAVAREVVDDLQVVIDEHGGRVEIGTLPTVPADALQMRQLLQNLVSNGLKFHREGVAPVVRVDGRAAADSAEITVSDNGIGFEERFAQRIFRVFERLHPRDAYPGTGVGLALCRRIAERHGGTIAATSVPGEGSTFTVTLPLTAPARPAARSGPGDSEERAPLLVPR